MGKSPDLFIQCHLLRASCVPGRVLCTPQTPAHSIHIPSSMRRVPLHPHLLEERTEAQRRDVTTQRHTATTDTRSEPSSPGSSVHSLSHCPALQDSSGSGGYEERRPGALCQALCQDFPHTSHLTLPVKYSQHEDRLQRIKVILLVTGNRGSERLILMAGSDEI